MVDADSLPSHIGRHFQVQSCLGAGGTSRVLHVIDQRNGQHLALKQALTPASERRARGHALFRQEFHVLSRILHPNVVRAYEYGFADERPFYTMELLRGRALSELAPLSWQRLCAVLLDLCSPLSMLHARRFVHGDVTARNVLVTERAETKLIDFGALTATDRPVLTLVGTPPHMAPELVRRQAIDGRVDMFAIGALAYNMLTGQHAYPAHTIQELPHAWTIVPPGVRERGFAIPAALDELIMSLLSLDASARPLQLAELVHRLSAIVDTAYVLDSASLQAQLATPKLVGRHDALEQFRAAERLALASSGAVMCFAGPKGIGRSRMLESCALEAIRLGCLVIHVSAGHAPNVAYGLVAQIFMEAHAQDAELLPFDADARTLGTMSEDALRAAWRALCAKRPVTVLIDDLTRADAASIRHCLGLSELARELPLLVVTAIETGTAALNVDVTALVAAGRTVALRPLTEPETAELLRSVFGEAAQLEALIAWVCRAASGLPSACVELAHHAVEQGYVRFVDGQFRVSDELSAGRAALPEALDATLARAIEGLSARAREALAALTLVTPFGALRTSEQLEYLCSAGWSPADALDVLDELSDAQLIVIGWEGYEPRFQSLETHAAGLLTEQQRRRWQLRLAALYEQRGHDARMLAVLHYDFAGETAKACEQLFSLDAQLRGPDDPNIKLGGSDAGIALHRRMLAYAIESAAPRLVVMHYRRVLLRIGATSDASLGSEAPPLLEQLRDDAGLSFWESCEPELDDRTRLSQCLARAEERFATSAIGERLAPREAVRQLAETIATATSICDAAFDAASARRLTEQFQPLAALGPLLERNHRNVETIAWLLSRGGLLIERWRWLLGAFQVRPEGLPELIWKYRLANLNYQLGRELALLGDPAALQHAEVLAAHRRTGPQAASVRLLYALALGDHENATLHRRQRAIAALASRFEDQRLGASYVAEIELLDACGDVLELQHTAAWFEAKATEFAGFRPFASYARALCLLLCGQVAEADQLIALQVHEVPALSHASWAALRALRAELALALGEPRLAQELALDVLRVAAEAGVDGRAHTRPRRVLALACAALGEYDRARAALEPWAQVFGDGPLAHTVHAGQLHETYARIALTAGDREGCALHCERAQAIYGRTGHPGLMARLQRITLSMLQSQSARDAANTHAFASIQTDLDRLSQNEQLDYLLALLLRDAEVEAGLLYHVSEDRRVRCLAAQLTAADDADFDAQVAAFVGRLAALIEGATMSVAVNTEDCIVRNGANGELERFGALMLRGSDHRVHGIALLRTPAPLLRTMGLATVVADVLAKSSAA